MPRVCIKDCSRQFLEGMAKSLARTIDSGTTHNGEGGDLRTLLEEVIAQIPDAPPYALEQRRRG